jgi:WD40 repeat protein
VSFAAEVAPVFHKRCLACHNARTAKGRYNMESFAAIMKGGESGAAIEPGNGELSGLCAMIEDGSMPKDADPLTAEQIAVIKKWVTLGARLDAGKDANAPLIQIMPKFPQPAPPEVYSIPIPVTAVAFSPDGGTLASSGYHEAILWSTADGSVQRRFTNVAERVYDLSFHPDGSLVAVAAGTPGQIGEVKVFKLADGQLVADLVTVEDAMFGVEFSPDGTRLAACGADRSIRLFDVATWKETQLIEDHADWVLAITWSPDGNKLVSASRDKTSKVFDSKTGDALITFNGHGEVVTGAVVLSDNAHAVTSGRDKRVRVWTLAEGKETKSITGFGDEVAQVAKLPDDRIFSASADKKARSHKSDGAAVATYDGHQDWIYSIAVHAGSGKLATGSYDGEIRIWTIDEPKTLLNWKAAPGYVSPGQASK